MKFFVAFLFFLCISSHDVNANAFSEVFGSEGASGINNSKIRSLSYTFQYFTVVGSIGYVAKQLFDSGYLEPIGLVPESISNLSSLAYTPGFSINEHNAKIIAVNQKTNEINLINDYAKEMNKNPFSSKSIEFRNNSNFKNSIFKKDQRAELIDRYLNE